MPRQNTTTVEAMGNRPENSKATFRTWKRIGKEPQHHQKGPRLPVPAETTQGLV